MKFITRSLLVLLLLYGIVFALADAYIPPFRRFHMACYLLSNCLGGYSIPDWPLAH